MALADRAVLTDGHIRGCHKNFSHLIAHTHLYPRRPRPLATEEFAGVVDVAGGATVVNALSRVSYGGAVAACGLAGGADLPTTVLPFILRGVTLAGVDSVMAPMAARQEAWTRMGTDLPKDKLDSMADEVPLAKVLELAPQILAGQVRGRVIVDVNA